MNVQTHAPTTPVVPPRPVNAPPRPLSYRQAARSRDFGVGYGNSSGYASGRRYASNWGNERFRCG